MVVIYVNLFMPNSLIIFIVLSFMFVIVTRLTTTQSDWIERVRHQPSYTRRRRRFEWIVVREHLWSRSLVHL